MDGTSPNRITRNARNAAGTSIVAHGSCICFGKPSLGRFPRNMPDINFIEYANVNTPPIIAITGINMVYGDPSAAPISTDDS